MSKNKPTKLTSNWNPSLVMADCLFKDLIVAVRPKQRSRGFDVVGFSASFSGQRLGLDGAENCEFDRVF